MWINKEYLFILIVGVFLQSGNGCEMDGIGQWALPQILDIVDIDRGIIFSKSSTNILGITNIRYTEDLKAGPYMDVSLIDSIFSISTNDAFDDYEQNETLQSFSITVSFSCNGGSSNTLDFIVNIRDTNNNAPQFLPSDEYEFTIALPVPPGFQITGCINDIIVRDVDLTTQRIQFGIEENPYFEITYDETSSEPKEFKAILKTTTLIRNLPEAVQLTISATDVDTTGDDPITTTAVIKIQGDSDFQLPEEPIFTHPFYLATYTDSEQLIISEPISLQQGYHEQVQFTLEGEYEENFHLVPNGNNLTIEVAIPLSSEALVSEPILLVVRAERQDTSGDTTTVVISTLTSTVETLQFENTFYEGLIIDNELQVPALVLSQGYDSEFTISINSEYSSLFDNEVEGNTIILSMTPLNDDIINENTYIVLEVVVTSGSSNASAFLVLEIIKDDNVTPVFEKYIYEGSYEADIGLSLETILITQGYDETVTFNLYGEHENLFSIQEGSGMSINVIASTIPKELFVEQYISLTVRANKVRTVGAAAAILIALPNARQLIFEKHLYTGSLLNGDLSLEKILMSGGSGDLVTFNLDGEYAEYFTISDGTDEVAISLKTSLPENVISENNFVALLLTASGFHAVSASTTIILDLVQPTKIAPLFSEAYYRGVYTLETGLQLEKSILITQGFDDSVDFNLDGGSSVWFSITNEDENVILKLDTEIPEEVIQNNNHLLFSIVASKPDSVDGRAVIAIELPKDFEQPVVIRFSQNSFQGSIENGQLLSPVITLEGGNLWLVNLHLSGEYAAFFDFERESTEIRIEITNPLPTEVINDNALIILELEASYPEAVSGYTAVILEIIKDVALEVTAVFEQDYYVGEYSEKNGLVFDHSMRLMEGSDDTVTFELEGENAQWFELVLTDDSIQLRLNPEKPIPSEVVQDFRQMIVLITAVEATSNATAKAVIIISIEKDIESGSKENFGKVLYTGDIRNEVLQYETISVTGYEGSDVEIIGEYDALFEVSITDQGEVIVERKDSVDLPSSVKYIVLELRISDSYAVLLLDVSYSDNPEPTPAVVTFSSSSYEVGIDGSRTGLIGHVEAIASNGENIQYSLNLNNVHLQQRLSIDTDGGLFLSAPANTGLYTFQVVAIAVISQTTATAEVNLSVDAVTICTDDDLVLPPLIILDRDEEEPYLNLVVLDKTRFEGCEYVLSNRWPSDQTWLYVDENGLHTRAIDREDPSIAFMALSQVQVELTLQCGSDNSQRQSPSVVRSDSLGPYDYGSGKWILTDAIPYNPRRSLVNLIVNDINDNYPIFNGKDYEPIAVGYPVRELEEIILPRALIVIKATDLDIGDNSAIQYWSSAEELVVSPTTGFVHVRDNVKLTTDAILRVFATDRNGEGLTSYLDIMIKLIDANNIAVVTIKDAFLNDEDDILDELTAAVGYEVKALSSAVVSQGSDLESRSAGSKKTRNTSATGSTLMLYVYGMISKEPVEVNTLTSDITTNGAIAINIARTVSLEDHLDSLEICVLPGRDAALFIATIVLSVLLFALIVAAVVWLLMRWIKKRAYDQFSDESSLTSRNDSISSGPKAESSPQPRIRVEDLLRSERRLQEILDSPVENTAKTVTLKKNIEPETKVIMPEPQSPSPIVIQSIDKLKDADLSDDDDEFGERRSKRKSVVTFNENVEKIIHLEDSEDEESNPEVYRF